MITICCIKWGEKYSSQYVNILYAMIKRNLPKDIAWRFICFTDDKKGISFPQQIEIFPIPDPTLTGWWTKISIFKAPLYDIVGKVLFLDLDVVVIDDLSNIIQFVQDNEFVAWKDINPLNGFNSGIMGFTANENNDIYEDLYTKKIPTKSDGKFGESVVRCEYWGDQVWITKKRKNIITPFPEKMITSFKYEKIIPNITKIVAFHGKPNPHESHSQIVKDHWKL